MSKYALSSFDDRVNQLHQALVSELSKAMALPQTENIRKAVGLVFGKGTRQFSRLLVEFDRQIERRGPAAGARWLLPHFVADFQACGQELIPPDGPLLVISNHPAACDSVVISSYIDRPDYKVIVGDLPPYHYLPHLCQHAIFSPPPDNLSARIKTVRDAVQHLKDGGSLLLFPRGGIEADPAFMPDPDGEFCRWSRSLEIFLRLVPATRVLVSIVSGVIAPEIMRHPITWLRQSRNDRQRLAFMYQIIRQIVSGRELFHLTPRITFGKLFAGLPWQDALAEVKQAARLTLAQHITHWHLHSNT